ncbi:MAG: threonine synthase [Candidatus Kapaibacterium sp.]|nr:MAG: threonine synthase [Candidatus Kapabacteria bacterium]
MLLYSTNSAQLQTNFLHAAVQGLANDGGLWMPAQLPTLAPEFFRDLPTMDFPTMANHVMQAFIGDEVPAQDLEPLVRDAFDFDSPLVKITDTTYALELFHGPTCAFKDFGARFMARALSYGRKQRTIANDGNHSTAPNEPSGDLYVLVATSGDTGSAVAHGFWNVPGIRVVILYPKGKVSELQEKQLTTMGGNIAALEVEGTFDDCQALVKTAFQDSDLMQRLALTSANSINIARLLPQSLYYFRAVALLPKEERERLVFCTPSGNFGNITGGLFAKNMGLPITRFIAASNRNDTFPLYLQSGVYTAKPSVATPSNAMDVGNPSNFARIEKLYGGSLEAIRKEVLAYSIADEATLETVLRVEKEHGYVMCPHTAVGYAAVEQYRTEENDHDSSAIVLATAHPAKFGEVIEPVLHKAVAVPERLAEYARKTKHSTVIPPVYEHLKSYLLKGA